MTLYIQTEIDGQTGDITGSIEDHGIKVSVTVYHPDDVLKELNNKVLAFIKKETEQGNERYKNIKPKDIQYYSAITGLKLNLS